MRSEPPHPRPSPPGTAASPDSPRRLTDRSHRWPSRLGELADPPAALCYLGDWSLTTGRCVAVVGARQASAAGREIARRLGRDLVADGLVVVSGLARGIDSSAHQGALDAGGKTIAVLGSGIDVCYPAEARPLYERIARDGLVISEFEAGALPLRHHFPRRNRIIAALAEAVVVVEGAERSGSRITADLALDLGREVMAVPRDPLAAGSATPNRLIKEGASPVTGAPDVLAVLGMADGARASVSGQPPVPLPDRLRWLHRALEPSPMGPEEIVQASGRSIVEVLPGLLDLELRGVVERLGSGMFRLRQRG